MRRTLRSAIHAPRNQKPSLPLSNEGRYLTTKTHFGMNRAEDYPRGFLSYGAPVAAESSPLGGRIGNRPRCRTIQPVSFLGALGRSSSPQGDGEHMNGRTMASGQLQPSPTYTTALLATGSGWGMEGKTVTGPTGTMKNTAANAMATRGAMSVSFLGGTRRRLATLSPGARMVSAQLPYLAARQTYRQMMARMNAPDALEQRGKSA